MRRVDVGGFELRAQVLGQDATMTTPTVVFDAGGSDGIEAWRELPSSIAAHSRVVVYERAGLGESDLGPEPRSARQVANELRALLRGLEVDPPYVLVGHSLGGLHIRIFADLFPGQVIGLVFLDPTTEGMHRSLWTEEGWKAFATQLESLPPGERAEHLALRDRLEELEAAGPPPDRPAVVISGMAPPHIPEEYREEAAAMGMTEERLRELQTMKHGFHARLAGQLPRGRHVEAKKSGHYVHWDEPELVTEAILEVLEEIRGVAPGKPLD